MKVKLFPCDLFLLMAVTLICVSFSVNQGTLDVYMFDTYFLFGLQQLCRAFTLYLVVLWIIYRLTHQLLYSLFLINFHIATTLLLVFFFALIPACVSAFYNTMPRSSMNYSSSENYETFQQLNTATIILMYVFVLAQFVFAINIYKGIRTKAAGNNSLPRAR